MRNLLRVLGRRSGVVVCGLIAVGQSVSVLGGSDYLPAVVALDAAAVAVAVYGFAYLLRRLFRVEVELVVDSDGGVYIRGEEPPVRPGISRSTRRVRYPRWHVIKRILGMGK